MACEVEKVLAVGAAFAEKSLEKKLGRRIVSGLALERGMENGETHCLGLDYRTDHTGTQMTHLICGDEVD